jgi:hypothetical protein
MSKVDAQRALRDARYARFAAAKSAAEATPAKSGAGKGAKTPAAKVPAAKPAEPSSDELFSAVPAATKKSDRPAGHASKSSPFTEAEPAAAGGEPATQPELLDQVAPAGSDAKVEVASAAFATTGAVTTDEPATGEPAAEESTAEELCGHRSMNGRTCTRTKGHEQKNHRYN